MSPASRVRQRIEAVLTYAQALGQFKGDNPAKLDGPLGVLLGDMRKKVEHHAALAYKEIPAFMADLRGREGTSARALEFLILSATRTNEVLGARLAEVDFDNKLWIVPKKRMKAKREHRVALSERAVEILGEMKRGKTSELIFPSTKLNRPMSNMVFLQLLKRMGRDDLTVHGFRSTFRDWCAEQTNFPAEVAEMALAHVVSDKVEAAYRRGDLLEKRFVLSQQWANYCMTGSV